MYVTTAGPHIYIQLNKQPGGFGPDLIITRYTKDCEERAISRKHLVN